MNSLKIFRPDGQVVNYTEGENGIKEICLMDFQGSHAHFTVRGGEQKEVVVTNLPYIFRR